MSSRKNVHDNPRGSRSGPGTKKDRDDRGLRWKQGTCLAKRRLDFRNAGPHLGNVDDLSRNEYIKTERNTDHGNPGSDLERNRRQVGNTRGAENTTEGVGKYGADVRKHENKIENRKGTPYRRRRNGRKNERHSLGNVVEVGRCRRTEKKVGHAEIDIGGVGHQVRLEIEIACTTRDLRAVG